VIVNVQQARSTLAGQASITVATLEQAQ